jgi:thiamine-monophosphate kinase
MSTSDSGGRLGGTPDSAGRLGGTPERTVSDVGENKLLERIESRFGARGSWLGDDAAVVQAPGSNLLLCVDAIVENVDFDFAWATGEDIGWKAVAVNVSDIAAMAGHPSYALASLTMRPDLPMEAFDGILEGIGAAASEFGLEMVGGDMSGGSQTTLSMSILGASGASGVLKRSGARAGQAICVTGSLGAAAAGLEVLRRDLRDAAGEPDRREAFERLALRQLRPRPNVDAAKALAGYGASAMIDVSDGLALDLDRLLQASRKGCSITSDSLPVDADARSLGDTLTGVGFDPLKAALSGGEDYEILCTLDVERFEAARRAVAAEGSSLTSIGVVTDGGRTIDGAPLDGWKEASWEHLRNR